MMEKSLRSFSPITGWGVNERGVHPINMFEVCQDNKYAIATPSGEVFDCNQTPFANIQEWMKYVNGGAHES
jgi:hypothetical protein